MTSPNVEQEKNTNDSWMDRHIWQIQPIRDIFWILLTIFIIYMGYQLRSIFTPVLIALALAYLFQPPINWLENKLKWPVPWPRPFIISILLGLLGIIVLVGSLLLGSIAWTQSMELINNLPSYVERGEGYIDERLNDDQKAQISHLVSAKVAEVKENPDAIISTVVQHVVAGSNAVATFLLGLLGTIGYISVTLLLIPIYFFFFAWQFDPMVRSLGNYVPKKNRAKTIEIVKKMDRVVSQYFRDRVIIAVLMSIMYCTGWAICGVPYWLLLGLAAGALSLVPYVSVLMVPVAILLAYLDLPEFSFWYVLVWPTMVYAVVQFIDGWILTPIIQGKSTEMSAVTIIIVVFVGGSVGGLYGIILCIPFAACLKILLTEVFLPRLKSWASEN